MVGRCWSNPVLLQSLRRKTHACAAEPSSYAHIVSLSLPHTHIHTRIHMCSSHAGAGRHCAASSSRRPPPRRPLRVTAACRYRHQLALQAQSAPHRSPPQELRRWEPKKCGIGWNDWQISNCPTENPVVLHTHTHPHTERQSTNTIRAHRSTAEASSTANLEDRGSSPSYVCAPSSDGAADTDEGAHDRRPRLSLDIDASMRCSSRSRSSAVSECEGAGAAEEQGETDDRACAAVLAGDDDASRGHDAWEEGRRSGIGEGGTNKRRKGKSDWQRMMRDKGKGRGCAFLLRCSSAVR